jgi:hypothetical protein
LGKELEPTNDENKFKCANKSDKAHGPIKISISLDLRFHLQGIDAPHESWEKIQVVFGKDDIIQSNQLEN